MDNLTHSLVGALLGQMGLKRKTAYATPTLVIAANLPDIDAACTAYGIESLAMRRGLTHGPIALLLLPLLLWALVIAFDAWRGRRGKRPAQAVPLHRGWLLALAFIGCASHPALDWLNNYGVRLLEPFSSRWFYGDTLFIIDVWIWAALAAALLLSFGRERRGQGDFTAPAWAGFGALTVYIGANFAISAHAETIGERILHAAGRDSPLVVASPPPLAFWQRDIFWRDGADFGSGTYSVGAGGTLDISGSATGMDDPDVAALAASDPAAKAFLFWARMPLALPEDGTLVLRDQRYMHPLPAIVSPSNCPGVRLRAGCCRALRVADVTPPCPDCQPHRFEAGRRYEQACQPPSRPRTVAGRSRLSVGRDACPVDPCHAVALVSSYPRQDR